MGELNESRAHLGYLLRFGVLVVLALGLVGGFNIAIDPERVYGTSPELNPHKARITRTGRAELIRRSDAQVVLVGSSRTARAFSPRHPGWAALGASDGRVINAGTGGANVFEARALALQALDTCDDLETIVLFVDFMMFNRTGPLVPGVNEGGGPQHDFANSRLNDDLPLPDYYLGHALSTHSVGLSRLTREQEDKGHRSQISTTGMRAMGAPRPAFNHRAAFERLAANSLQPGYLYGRWAYAQEGIAMVADVIAAAEGRGVRTVVAIPPIHAHQLEVIRAAGLADQYEQFKRELVGVSPDGVWDFAVYNVFTMELVPPDAKGRMVNWWESSHATQAYGSVVISRLTGRADAQGDEADESVGVPVDASTIDEHLAGQRAARDVWAAANPDEVATIRQISERARERGWWVIDGPE